MGWYADDEVEADMLVPEHGDAAPQQTTQQDIFEARPASTDAQPVATAQPEPAVAGAGVMDGQPSSDAASAFAQPEPVAAAESLHAEAHIGATTSEQPALIPDDSYNAHLGDDLEYTAEEGAEGSDEWDGTVLSTAFMKKEPRHVYRLVNEVTGQSIVVDMGVLMGRKPSQDIPQGAKSVRLVDPTRTVSRNHAAISFDQDGSLWIEDYGSLNGTYVVDGEDERQVVKGTPMRLTAPCKVRIGDQIFDFEDGAE